MLSQKIKIAIIKSESVKVNFYSKITFRKKSLFYKKSVNKTKNWSFLKWFKIKYKCRLLNIILEWGAVDREAVKLCDESFDQEPHTFKRSSISLLNKAPEEYALYS